VPPSKGGARKPPARKRPPAAKKGSRPAQPAASRSREARAAREARALRKRILTAGVLLVVAGVVVFFAVQSDRNPPIEPQLRPCRVDGKFDGTDDNQGAHVRNPTYTVDPPAGGPHFPSPAEPGFYRGSRVPTDGELVHAMEHGFVVLWVRSGLPDDKMAKIEALSDQFGRELIVVERPSLTDEVAVTAWHKRMFCAELSPDRVGIFTREFKDRGPEKGFL
jgi:hypothetical protein